MRSGIAISDQLTARAAEILQAYDVHVLPADEAFLSGCRVLLGWPSRIKPEVLKRMKMLEMIQSLSAGVDALPLSEIPLGVKICSNAGAYTKPVAEHAWGLLLGLAKGMHLRNHRATPRMLRGKTLLVVGAGGIGSEVARLSKSLEMKTLGVSRSFYHPEDFDEMHGPEELRNLVARADAIALALPLNGATRGLIDSDLLLRMNENVLVVNVGRGETVREEDLVRWLRRRPESRYATDVFWKKDGKEVFDTPAWELPNFGGTLHISGVPLGSSLEVPFAQAAENVREFLETGRARNVVDRADYG